MRKIQSPLEYTPDAPIIKQYYADRAALLEPNLLVPGKKPIGAVKIDWSHPLTVNLKSFLLLSGNGRVVDLVTGNRLSYANHTFDANFSQSVYLDNTAASYITCSTPIFGLAKDITLVTDFYLESTITANQVYLTVFNSADSSRYIFYKDTVQKMDIFSSESGTNLFRSDNQQMFAGDRFQFAVVCGDIAADCYLYRDGAPIVHWGGTGSGAHSPTGFDNIVIGNNHLLGSTQNSEMSAFFASAYEGALTEKEIKELYRDPYQILVPA